MCGWDETAPAGPAAGLGLGFGGRIWGWGCMCECVCVLKGIKDVSWKGAKVMMTDPQFLRSLIEYDKDAITDKQASHRP